MGFCAGDGQVGIHQFVHRISTHRRACAPVGDPAIGNNFDQCPDADVVMSYSTTDKDGNPLGWSPVLPVNTEPLDQIMPSCKSWKTTLIRTNIRRDRERF